MSGSKSSGFGFVVAQAGAGDDEVEDLDDLGAEAAGELALVAEGVLGGDASLFVGGGAERQVGGAEQLVVGDDAVTGGVDVREVGAHPAVDDDRALDAELGAGGGGEFGLGSHADDDEDDVGRVGRVLRRLGRSHVPGAGASALAAGASIASTRVSQATVTP